MFSQHSVQEAALAAPLSWGAFALLAYWLARVIYLLYFHPLSDFPGPFWAKISTIPSFWHTLQRDRHLWLWSLEQEYGMQRLSTLPRSTSLDCMRQAAIGLLTREVLLHRHYIPLCT